MGTSCVKGLVRAGRNFTVQPETCVRHSPIHVGAGAAHGLGVNQPGRLIRANPYATAGMRWVILPLVPQDGSGPVHHAHFGLATFSQKRTQANHCSFGHIRHPAGQDNDAQQMYRERCDFPSCQGTKENPTADEPSGFRFFC